MFDFPSAVAAWTEVAEICNYSAPLPVLRPNAAFPLLHMEMERWREDERETETVVCIEY